MSQELSAPDGGSSQVSIASDVENGVIIVQFEDPVKWIGFSADEARILAEALMSNAKYLEEHSGQTKDGKSGEVTGVGPAVHQPPES